MIILSGLMYQHGMMGRRDRLILVARTTHNLPEIKALIDLYEPVSDSILKPDLVSWYK